jgi:hypothetical protein
MGVWTGIISIPPMGWKLRVFGLWLTDDQNLNTKVVAYIHGRDRKTMKLLGKLWRGNQEQSHHQVS